MGTYGTLSSWSSEPDCGDYGTIKYLTELGTSKSLNSTYEVRDDSGNRIWSGSLDLEANSCIVVKLSE